MVKKDSPFRETPIRQAFWSLIQFLKLAIQNLGDDGQNPWLGNRGRGVGVSAVAPGTGAADGGLSPQGPATGRIDDVDP